MSAHRKTLYLIDGSALVYRAFFAFIRNPLINSKGENTSATFGFVNSLLKIIREEDPEYLAIVFDTPEPTFRHERYPEYKSTRAKMPEELVAQLPRVRQAIEALNVPIIELPGYEADDVIGTLAKQAAAKGFEVWCVTGDKDYFQLVDERIRIYYPKRAGDEAERLGPEEVREKFGVLPERVIDKLALMGDSSDNIPGIPGIGPKTADQLLAQFGSLENILKHADDIKSAATRRKVVENADKALLSRELVTIRTDVPLDITLEQLRRGPIDLEATKKLFLELEFNTLLRQLMPENGEAAAGAMTSEQDYRTVADLAELRAVMAELGKADEIVVDTETTSLDAMRAKLVGVSLTDRPGRGWYIPLAHSSEPARNLPMDEALSLLRKLLQNRRIRKVGQNLKYDIEVLHHYDIDIDPVSFDTMLASYVLDPSARQHSLDMLAIKHLNYTMQPISELIGKGKKQKSFAVVPVDQATRYAVEDVDITCRLKELLAPRLEEAGVAELYRDIELPLVKVLASMEEAGVRVDDLYLQELSDRMEKRLGELQEQIFELAGGEFNINSTQQLSHVLFDKLKLPVGRKTAKKTGYSTDVGVLEELAHLHPLPQLILDYRQLTKLKNTYIDALPKLINPETGRIHTSYNQAVAATGRLSSQDPNLQNIPVRTEEGREIRRAFVPRDDAHLLLTADYSQIELRILAHMSGDKGLIAAFKNHEDIHTRTASEVFGVPAAAVTPEMRRVAKTANFAVTYGVTPYGLSQQTAMTVDEAKQFIDTYFERYPGVLEYIEKTKAFAREHGYVTTLFNRRRFVADISSKNYNVRQFAERTAINTPIQGTAADIIKLAMIRIYRKLAGKRSVMVLQVHDELVLDVHRDEVEEVRTIVKDGMEKAARLKVPLVADIGVGENWLEAK